MDKTLQLLGLARRAGKLVIGRDAVLDAVKKNKTTLILLTSDASPRHRRELENAGCRCPVASLSCDMPTAGAATGRVSCIFALTDAGFAAAVTKTINEEEAHHGSEI